MEEKTQKKRAIDKKSLWLIIGGSLLGVAIIVGVVLAFLLGYNSNAPGQVNIVKLDKTYFSVNSNNNYRGYRFVFNSNEEEFVFNSNEEELVFESEDNVIVLDELEGLEAGKKYQISACYLGETESANSDYSQPVEWTCYLKLQMPTLIYSESENGIISWNSIDRAKYYRLYILNVTTNDILTTIETTGTFYDLNNFDGGQFEIMISACSNNAYIEQSTISKAVTVEFYKNFKDFDSASINLNSNNLLTITGSQLITEIDVQIDGVWYVDRPVSATNSDGVYTYYVSLVDFPLSEGSVVMVRPSNIDSYNSYSGSGIQAQFE